MKVVMVRCKVKADRASENVSYITKVFEQLKREMPTGLHYASFRLNDGVSFIHIASHDETNPLTTLSAFKAFTAQIKDRCEELPVTVDLNTVDAYRFFAE
jgi:hypothetical protein